MSLLRLVSRMSRPIRIEFAEAIYHLMARGNQGQEIYADDGDRNLWVATLVEARRRTGWRIHAGTPGQSPTPLAPLETRTERALAQPLAPSIRANPAPFSRAP